jgi:O-antigen/teichoic acid export membrane protein
MKKSSTSQVNEGGIFKKVAQKGGIYFISSILIKVLQVIILPLITRYIDTRNYGILEIVNAVRMVMPSLISLCLDAAYYRFYYKYNNDEKMLRRFVSSYFWLIVGWGAFFILISIVISFFYLGANSMDYLFHPFMTLAMMGILLYQLSFIGNAFQLQNLKAEFVGLVNIVYYLILNGVFVFLIIAVDMKAEAKIYGIFAADIFYFLIYLWVLLRKKLIRFEFDFQMIKEGLKYSLPLIPSQLCSWITLLSDKLVVGAFKGFSETGIYSIGYSLAQMVAVFSGAIFLAYKPIMYEGFSEDDKKGGEKVSQFLPVYYFTCLWCVVGTCVLGREAIMILTESSYHGAFVFIPIVALAYLFQAWYRPFNEILNFYKKTVLVAIGSIIQGVANLLLNILLVPKFGAMGASWATFVSLFLLGAFVFVWSQKIYPIHISYYKLIGITMPAVVCYLILSHWSEEIFSLGLLWAILIKGLAVCVFVVLTFVFRILRLKDFKK